MQISLAFTACGTLGALILATLPTPTVARPNTWGNAGWNAGYDGYGGSYRDSRSRSSNPRSSNQRDSREGHVQVSRFRALDITADVLGKGPVTVTSETTTNRDGPPAPSTSVTNTLTASQPDDLSPQLRAPFEAAVVDRLIAAGYDTMQANPDTGHIAELRVSRTVLVPAEGKRKPVSGTAAMQVGTRGSAYGLGVNVDMSKPLPALLSTRLDARIKDRVSGKILWEGHAQIATRDGDDKWNNSAIATRLAAALFDNLRDPTT